MLPTRTTRKLVIFTDLDGTLLDRNTYSFEPALPALNLIKQKGIPLILSSSKTRAEIELYQKQLENDHPFVSENGGAIFITKDYFSFNIQWLLHCMVDNIGRILTRGLEYTFIQKGSEEETSFITKGFG